MRVTIPLNRLNISVMDTSQSWRGERPEKARSSKKAENSQSRLLKKSILQQKKQEGRWRKLSSSMFDIIVDHRSEIVKPVMA